MMSSTFIFLLVEVFIILLAIVFFLFYLRWKRKKLKSAEIEKLLDNINSQQAERLSLLTELLIEKCGLQDDPAKESGGLMIEAEKQFLQQFLKQQIEQTPLTDFYSNLCELLDQYLYLLTPAKTEQNISIDETPLEITEAIEPVENEFDIGDKTTIEPEEESVLDDEFTESEADMDGTTKPDAESDAMEDPGLDDEFAEAEDDSEPDWGDAFAESGDEVDEATKDGYDADLKKE